MTTITTCTCSHPYQDKRHGPQQRVHNAAKEGWRCTVCHRVKDERHGLIKTNA